MSRSFEINGQEHAATLLDTAVLSVKKIKICIKKKDHKKGI